MSRTKGIGDPTRRAPWGSPPVARRPLDRSRETVALPISSSEAWLRPQVLQSGQVEAGAGEDEDGRDLLLSPVTELAQIAHGLHPAEGWS